MHTAASAAAVGGGVAAGDAVTAEDMLALQAAAEAAAAATAAAINAAYLAEGTFADADEAAAAAAAAALAQDADAAAALAALAAEVAADAGVVAAAEAESDAAALVTAASGTAAIAAVKDALNIDQRFRMNVNATAESDNGLSFGAMVRMQADESGDNAGVVGINAPRFSVSSGGLTLAVGNTYGAIDSMPGVYAGTVGLTGLGFSNVATNFGSQTYSSTGAGVNGVEVIYSAGDLTLHVSTVKDAATEVAVAYSMNGITLGLGASNTDVATNAEWVASVGGKLGDASVTLVAAQTVAGNTSMTLSGSFAVGAATTVTGYIANDEGQADQSAYGLGVVHNLGGGASIRGGIANTHGTNRADLGVQFNF